MDAAHALSSVKSEVVKRLRMFIVRQINYNWAEMSENIGGKLNKIRDGVAEDDLKKIDNKYVVILPKYRRDEHTNIFTEEFKDKMNDEYMKIGYDSKEVLAKGRKYERNRHYRYCLDESYESYYQRVYKVPMGVYEEIPLRKGRVLLP